MNCGGEVKIDFTFNEISNPTFLVCGDLLVS